MFKFFASDKPANLETQAAAFLNGSDDSASAPSAKIACAGMTDVGRKRIINQDHFMIADLHKSMHVCESSMPSDRKELFGTNMGKLMFVADGMGGANAGDVASQLAIEEMTQHLLNSMHWLFSPKQPEIEQFVDDLKAGALRTHSVVRDDSKTNPEHRGMGTTLTVAYLIWPMLYVLHVGDSRCYILRNDKLQRLTKDQTLAQFLFDQGQISESEFSKSPYQHILISAIGCEEGPDALVYKTRLQPSDRILICSDGVNAHLSDEDIELKLSEGSSPRNVCESLIATANERGGRDNITVVVAFSEHADPP